MSRFEVEPGALRAAGSGIGSIGERLSGLAGHAHGVGGGAGAPSATAGALHVFAAQSAQEVAELGRSTSELAACVGAAADLYERVDAQVMPAS